MKKSIIAGGLSAVLLASAALYAAPGAPGGKMAIDTDGNGAISKTESLAAADKLFAKMDVNSDGKIDAGDREAKVKQKFVKLDKDGNGSVTEAEFLADHADREAKRAEWAQKRGDRKAAADDGAPQGGHKGWGGHRDGGRHGGDHGGMGLKAADTNGDKVITQAEFRAAAEARFAKKDTNKDGTISADEMKAGWKGKRGGHGDHSAPPPPPAVDGEED